jgi:hypothetical protein
MTIAGMYAEPCPECAGPVLPALDSRGNFSAIEPSDDGTLIASPDENGIGYFRVAVPGRQLALDELLCRLHDPVCPVLQARVRGIATARSLRHHAPRTVTPRRTASAR